MARTSSECIGIVGVGRMGLAMTKHLLKHGYAVTACDLDATQTKAAHAAGAEIVATAADVAKASQFVIIAVGYDEEVHAVVLGQHGLLGSVASGSVIAVSSTCTPDNVKALETRAKTHGVAML